MNFKSLNASLSQPALVVLAAVALAAFLTFTGVVVFLAYLTERPKRGAKGNATWSSA